MVLLGELIVVGMDAVENQHRMSYVATVLVLVATVSGCSDLAMNPFLCSDPIALLGSPADGWTEPWHPYGVGFIRYTPPEEGKAIAKELESAIGFDITYIATQTASFTANMTPRQRDLVWCDPRVRYVEYVPSDYEEP